MNVRYPTTSFKMGEDNIAIVQELTKTRELPHIINALLRSYTTNKEYIEPSKRIEQLEEQLKKKEEQYKALKDGGLKVVG